MKIFIVLAHAEVKSFNASMFQQAIRTLETQGHQVQTSDLYRMEFSSRSYRNNYSSMDDAGFFKQQLEELRASKINGFSPEIEAEISKVEWCDLMIWQFPLWWFSVPGVLKGWVDRVFAMGRVYGEGRMFEQGYFKGKKALLSITTGAEKTAYSKDGLLGDIDSIIRHVQRGMLAYTGFDVLKPHIIYGPVRMEGQGREDQLEKYSSRLKNIFEEGPIEVGRY
ncbi:NAD(P)H-dependent oxidoreductase [Pedobacter ginsengiterrae]|uniref:NAD(P)H-dependent oxidoreductase n=1 Tax=Pedobacter ginsengiterrae TaxID=871696 RepID=A0ABP7PGF7_9SPHI